MDGAQGVAEATKCATRIRRAFSSSPLPVPINADSGSSWTIDDNVRKVVRGMLSDLPDLWPARGKSVSPEKTSLSTKSSEAGKSAQKRQMEKIRLMQAKFAATIGPSDPSTTKAEDTENKDLCTICRCDDVECDRGCRFQAESSRGPRHSRCLETACYFSVQFLHFFKDCQPRICCG